MVSVASPPDWRTLAAGSIRAATDFLLPAVCAACDRLCDDGERDVICGRCWARLVHLGSPSCMRCGHPTGQERCRWCAQLPPFVRAVRSVCWTHRGTGSTVVYALKYGGWPTAAEGMALRMSRLGWPPDVASERTALVPVPLARDRERERGFNQSERIAAELAQHWRLPVWANCIERTRGTRTQTRLTPAERRHNVAGAFRASPGGAGCLRGSHIMLVDDVVTTAATLNACAATLFAAGARIISYVTFGRAPALGDAPS